MEAAEKIVSEGQAVLGTLKDLGRVTVMPVDPGSREEVLWDSLVREHHSLGYKNLPGRQVKYIAWVGEQPVAALSFSGPKPSMRPIPPSTSSPMRPNPFPLTQWSRSRSSAGPSSTPSLRPNPFWAWTTTSTAPGTAGIATSSMSSSLTHSCRRSA